MSTPKSSKGGDRGAEVQEVELKKASGNGDPGCWGENNSSCMGEGEPNNNRKKKTVSFEWVYKTCHAFMYLSVCVCCSKMVSFWSSHKNTLAMVAWWTINWVLLRQRSDVNAFSKWEYKNANLQSVKYNNHGETFKQWMLETIFWTINSLLFQHKTFHGNISTIQLHRPCFSENFVESDPGTLWKREKFKCQHQQQLCSPFRR